MRNEYKIFVGKPEGRDHSNDPGVGERIILDWVSGKQGGKLWTEFIWLKITTTGGLL
jgi:hypothetical protein